MFKKLVTKAILAAIRNKKGINPNSLAALDKFRNKRKTEVHYETQNKNITGASLGMGDGGPNDSTERPNVPDGHRGDGSDSASLKEGESMNPNNLKEMFEGLKALKEYENNVIQGYIQQQEQIKDMLLDMAPDDTGSSEDDLLAAVLPQLLQAKTGAPAVPEPGNLAQKQPAQSEFTEKEARQLAQSIEQQMPAKYAEKIRKGVIDRGTCLNFLRAQGFPMENAELVYNEFLEAEVSKNDFNEDGPVPPTD